MSKINPDQEAAIKEAYQLSSMQAPYNGDFSGQKSGPRDLTFGQRAVGMNFNPSGNHDVYSLKRQFANIIDQLDRLRMGSDSETKPDAEVARLASIAITEAQGAQMWAVKAATWGK